jgi:hypothetical protein
MSVNHWNSIQVPYGHNLQAPYSKLTGVSFLIEDGDDMGIKYTNILTWCNGWKQEVTYALGSNKSSHFNGKLRPFYYRLTFKENTYESDRQSQTCIFFPLALHNPLVGVFYSPLSGFSLLAYEVTWSYSDAPQSVGLLWTNDQSVAETSTVTYVYSYP